MVHKQNVAKVFFLIHAINYQTQILMWIIITLLSILYNFFCSFDCWLLCSCTAFIMEFTKNIKNMISSFHNWNLSKNKQICKHTSFHPFWSTPFFFMRSTCTANPYPWTLWNTNGVELIFPYSFEICISDEVSILLTTLNIILV